MAKNGQVNHENPTKCLMRGEAEFKERNVAKRDDTEPQPSFSLNPMLQSHYKR